MDFPLVNAILNGVSATFLVCGFIAIKKKNAFLHKHLMISAFISSTLFFTSYLIYHFTQGHFKFQGDGIVRLVYFLLLIPHILLAIVMIPLIFRTFFLAFQGRFSEHRCLAKWTFPIWLYVSITGVLLYVYIYILFPFNG